MTRRYPLRPTTRVPGRTLEITQRMTPLVEAGRTEPCPECDDCQPELLGWMTLGFDPETFDPAPVFTDHLDVNVGNIAGHLVHKQAVIKCAERCHTYVVLSYDAVCGEFPGSSEFDMGADCSYHVAISPYGPTVSLIAYGGSGGGGDAVNVSMTVRTSCAGSGGQYTDLGTLTLTLTPVAW